MPTAGHFLPTAAENAQRTPSKPMVLKSFARLGCCPRGSLLPRAPDAQVYHLAFVSSLRLQPLAAHADPRWPGAAGMDSASTVRGDVGIALYTNLGICFRRAGCPHPAVMVRVDNGGASRRRPLRNSIGKRSVGADAYIGPPAVFLVTCHCEASAHTGCGNPFFFPYCIRMAVSRRFLPKKACKGVWAVLYFA